MNEYYAKYYTDDGHILVAVDSLDNASEEGVIKAGLHDNIKGTVQDLKVGFDDALDVVHYSAKAFSKKVHSLSEPPDEMELSFGLKATASGDLVVAKASAEANFNIKLTWRG